MATRTSTRTRPQDPPGAPVTRREAGCPDDPGTVLLRVDVEEAEWWASPGTYSS